MGPFGIVAEGSQGAGQCPPAESGIPGLEGKVEVESGTSGHPVEHVCVFVCLLACLLACLPVCLFVCGLVCLCEICTFSHVTLPCQVLQCTLAQALYFGISRGQKRLWACRTCVTYFRVASHLVCSVVSEPATFAVRQAELKRAQETLVDQWRLSVESLTLPGRFVFRCPRLSLEHLQVGKSGVGTLSPTSACLIQRWKFCWMT